MSFFEELRRRNVIRVAIAYGVTSWFLLQLADIVLENTSAPGWVIQVIMLVLGIGFPLVVIFAWAFEMTPEGIKKEKDVDRSQSITTRTGRKLDRAIIGILTVVVAYLLIDKLILQEHSPEKTPKPTSHESAVQTTEAGSEKSNPAPAEGEVAIKKQSIAVLPFDNRSNREEDQFFTDGIHDDLLTTIAKIGSMKVISRTSVMEYKNTTRKIPEIAKELGVANILEGGIQRSGNQVRINVQLIDAVTDEHLWAEIYDRELTAENLFAIQSEISQAIAVALEATLSPEEKQRINTMPTDNLAAYDAYLRGRQLMATRDSAQLEQAVEEFNKAVELDPQFALAWVGVADSNNLFSNYGAQLSAEESFPIRKEAINLALAIDDQVGEAYASLGHLHGDKQRFEDAESAYRRSIELSPNYATAYHWYSNFLKRFPLRIDETIELARKASELDPRSSIIGLNLGSAYQNRGLYSMAERQYQKVIELDPDFVVSYDVLVNLYTYSMSRYEKALLNARKVYELDPGYLRAQKNVVDIYLELGDMEAAQNVREQMAELDAENVMVGYADLLISATNRNRGGVLKAINWLMPKTSDLSFLTQLMGRYALAQGEKALSRELYLSANPGWIDPSQWQNLIEQYPGNGCAVSWILINTGDEQLGKELLQKVTIFFDETLSAAIEHTDNYGADICYLTAGDTEKALLSIETQLAHNHLFAWDRKHQAPMYDLIRFEPRYQAAVAERERRISIMRETIATMDAEPGHD